MERCSNGIRNAIPISRVFFSHGTLHNNLLVGDIRVILAYIMIEILFSNLPGSHFFSLNETYLPYTKSQTFPSFKPHDQGLYHRHVQNRFHAG